MDNRTSRPAPGMLLSWLLLTRCWSGPSCDEICQPDILPPCMAFATQHVDCFLEGSRNINSLAVRFPFHLASIDVIKRSRLYPLKLKSWGVSHGLLEMQWLPGFLLWTPCRSSARQVAKPVPSHLVKCPSPAASSLVLPMMSNL